MSHVVRKRGKPNRGGGRFNRGGGGSKRGGGGGGSGKHGGGGGGGRRKEAASNNWMDDDWSLEGTGSQPPRPSGAPTRHGRGGQGTRGRGGRGGGQGGARGRGGGRTGFGLAGGGGGIGARASSGTEPGGLSLYKHVPSSAEVKVPLQRLHMSTENQDMVRDMLRDLHNGDGTDMYDDEPGEEEDDFECDESDSEVDELDWRLEDQYWTTDRQMVVEEAETNVPAILEEEDPKVFTADHVSKIAINKLGRYGFDRQRSVQALVKMRGDIGQALECLLNDAFDLGLKFPENTDDLEQRDFEAEGLQETRTIEDVHNMEEVNELRSEEKTVLESIYEEAFTERIAGSVWVLGLDVPLLDKLADDRLAEEKREAAEKQVREAARLAERDKREVCRFYLRGSCKFGADRCRYKHESPVKEGVPREGFTAGPAANTEDADEHLYELEVRFPPGNKYPFEAPVVAFSTRSKCVPYYVCLNISKRLLQEARSLAECQSPAVFPMASLLEVEEEVIRLFFEAPLPFSNPPPVITQRMQKPPSALPEVVRYDIQSKVSNRTPPKEDMSEEYEQEEEEQEEESEEIAEVEEDTDKNDAMRQKYGRGRKSVLPRQVSVEERRRTNRRLIENFKRKQGDSSYQKMQAQRQELPAWNKRDEVVARVASAQVVVISGMTGCGKSTQVPQYLLDASLVPSSHQGSSKGRRGPADHVANIICTQPRRLSAMAVAERVADERAEKCGGEVGYQIRLESRMSSRTRLLFCTTGILLRRMEGDGRLSDVTHVILDEVHERTEESDFLLMVLRDLVYERPDLKLILMSATLNANLFSDYFQECPVIEIPGRTFPVDQYFLEDAVELTRYTLEDRSPFARSLKPSNTSGAGGRGGRGSGRPLGEDIEDELQSLTLSSSLPAAKDNVQDQRLTIKQLFVRYSDYKKSTIKTLATMDHEKINMDLIQNLLEWIVSGEHEYPPGAVLVFLPGMQEITTLYEQLLLSSTFGGRNKQKFKLIPLHSTLSSEEQHAVFSRPKEGVTKIVISTNIAETSITIDDIVYVIDAGLMKEKRYDSDKSMESLEVVCVSRANALQRKGRAGRVASGVCFHLFTSHRFEHHLREQPIPEIQRAPLESIVLRIKVLDIFQGYRVEEVLNRLIEPPSPGSLTNSIKRLQDLGALDLDQNLTPLGYHLAALPVDVRIGKLMLFGAIFRCLDAALTIAATLSFKSPFVSPFDKRDEADKKKLEFATCSSDHLTMLKAYTGWISAQKKGGRAGFLYCQDNFLSVKTMQMLSSMKRQFVELLSDIGFIEEGLTTRYLERAARNAGDGVIECTGPEANSNNDNMKLVAAILVGALFPNVVQVLSPENKYSLSGTGAIPRAPKPEEIKFKTKKDGYVSIHPSSVNFQVRYFESPYLVYHEKVKTTKVYIRDCTMVSVYPLLLFGGSISIDLSRGNFMLAVDDGWIRFMATSHAVAELVRELRLELDRLLQDKIETPNMDLCTCPRGSRIIDTIVQLITTQ